MKTLSVFAAIMILAIEGSGQMVYTLDGTSGTRVYSSITEALTNAENGDYLYLPGGVIHAPAGFIIQKKIYVIGAGHHLDSTLATGQTIIDGNVRFLTTSSGSMLQGVHINGHIYFGTDGNNAAPKNILISRCNVRTIHLSEDGSTYRAAEGVLIRENVIREDINFAYVQNVSVENNLIEGQLAYTNGQVLIKNNIFLRRYGYMFLYAQSIRMENNLFLGSGIFIGPAVANLYFYNNVFKEGDPLGAYFSSNNQFNVTNLLVSQSGTAFQYQDDYHLTANSPARNAGFDAKDCGIYGGANPYKNGAVPLNPHIRSKEISAQTDGQGMLQIKVTVAAQEQ